MKPYSCQKHCCRRTSRYCQSQKRNHRTSYDCIIGSFCCSNPLQNSGTKLFSLLGISFCCIIGNPCPNIFSCPGYCANTYTNKPGTDCSRYQRANDLPAGYYLSNFTQNLIGNFFFKNNKNFRNTKNTD